MTIAAAIVIVAIAIIVLQRLAADVSWEEVRHDIANVPASHLLAAIAFTLLSFTALACYDVLAVATVAPGKVPRATAAMAGASGFAISNLLGFSWLTGGALRFRIYAAVGLDWALVTGVITMSLCSIWLGITLLIGLILVVHPEGLATALGLSPALDTALGGGVLLALGGFYWWLSRGRRVLNLAGFRLALPSARMASALTLNGIADALGAALALYVLLPGDLTQNFPLFFIVYVAAIGLGLISHSPGGLGVFEATMIAGLDAGGRPEVLAALVLYRLIDFVLPFAVAVTGIALAVIMAKRREAGAFVKSVHAIARPLVPPIVAAITLVSGALLVISGNLPAETARLHILRDLLPLPVIEASHLLGSVAGVLLIVVAHGLYKKQRRAWLTATGLMAVGLLTSLSKGLDWEEAVSLALALGLMTVFRSAFYRSAGGSLLRLNWRWLLGSVAFIAAATWIGFFAYSHVDYSNDLWWRFAWAGDAPRFLRASLATATVLAAVGLHSLINAHPSALQPEPIPSRVRELVRESPLTEANIALTGDKRFLLAEDGRAFIAYADTGGSLIAKGDPVGDQRSGEAIIWQMREMADRFGRRCAFYAVTQDYLPVYLDMGMSLLKIGEVARVDLTSFSLAGPARSDFRQAHRRAGREGYRFDIVRTADLDPDMATLRRVSDAWLASKHGEEKGFALGAFTEDYMRNFDCAVLRHEGSGGIVAFANLFQGAAQFELSIDLMRYDPSGPKYAMNALFAFLLLWGRAEGFKWFSLGAAPFAGMRDHPLATVWNRIGSYVYRHGEHFYHFEGLRAFKEKFGPEWSPNYLASPRGLDAPLVLYEVNKLISGGIKGLIK